MIDESIIEQAALDYLESLGYATLRGNDIAPGEPAAERADYGQVILEDRLHQALVRLNPAIPADVLDDAYRKLTRPEGPTLEARNRQIHRWLIDGVTVEYRHKDLPAPRPGIFFVYAIRCADNSIYIGQTDNLDWRWREHEAGTASEHTRRHKPVRVVHYEGHYSREEVVKCKKRTRNRFWQNLVKT